MWTLEKDITQGCSKLCVKLSPSSVFMCDIQDKSQTVHLAAAVLRVLASSWIPFCLCLNVMEENALAALVLCFLVGKNDGIWGLCCKMILSYEALPQTAV